MQPENRCWLRARCSDPVKGTSSTQQAAFSVVNRQELWLAVVCELGPREKIHMANIQTGTISCLGELSMKIYHLPAARVALYAFCFVCKLRHAGTRAEFVGQREQWFCSSATDKPMCKRAVKCIYTHPHAGFRYLSICKHRRVSTPQREVISWYRVLPEGRPVAK